MHCLRCREKMIVEAHRPHKQEKWRCQRCGVVRKRPARYRRARSKAHWQSSTDMGGG